MPASPLERTRPVTLRLEFSPVPTAARSVSIAARDFLEENGVEARDLFPFELCVSEATNNSIEYSQGPARFIRPVAEILLTPEHLEIRVTDHTPGFEMPEHIAPPSAMDERGRGLFLIQSVMDEVVYNRGRHENVLVMRKQRTGTPDRADAIHPRLALKSHGNPPEAEAPAQTKPFEKIAWPKKVARRAKSLVTPSPGTRFPT